jgi:hypothetical protein
MFRRRPAWWTSWTINMDDCRAFDFDYVLAGKERIISIIEFRSRSGDGELSLYQCVRVE